MAEQKTDCIHPQCPNPDNHLWINRGKGVFICFRCGYSGTTTQLRADYEEWYGDELDLNNIAGQVPEREWRDVDLSEILEPDENGLEESREESCLPDDCRPVSETNTVWGKRSMEYLEGRGVDKNTARFFDLHYGVESRMGTIIAPIYNRSRSKVVYYVQKRFGAGEEGYYNPPNEVVEKRKSEVLYNQSRVKKGSAIYLVEGIFDVMAMGPQALGLIGKTISDAQMVTLWDMEPSHITVCLDADAGSDQADVASRLRSFWPISVIDLDEGDPGDLTETQRMEAIRSASRFDLCREVVHRVESGDRQTPAF